MMGHSEPLKCGIEQDAISSWRKVLACCKRPGFRHYAKRKIRRRERQISRRELREGL